ncbi:MAG: PEGA domain-containing protein [FCB group bacterium]|nr:PEGA domain-containing protein [FCB group bacterium]
MTKRILQIVLILTLMLSLAVTQETLNEFEVTIKQMDQGVTFPNMTKVLVKSSVKNLTFDSNRGILKVEKTGEGEWKLTLDPGSQRFEIKAEGFLSYSERHNFKAGKAYDCRVSKKIHELTQLDANLFEVTFKFNTENVYCSKDRSTPVMSIGDLAIFKLPEGEYTFSFTKDQFKPVAQSVKVDQDLTIPIELVKDTSQRLPYVPPGTVNIETEPTGAEITINGIKSGISNATITNLSAGEHQLELRKELYYPYAGKFDLKEGEMKTLSKIILTPRYGYLTVNSRPAGARIYLDGTYIGDSPILKKKVESGDHSLGAKMELYSDYQEDITLKDGESIVREFQLESSGGTLNISARDESGNEIKDADVIINGEFAGLTPFLNRAYPAGKYSISVQKEYYDTSTESVILEAKKSISRTVLLKSNMSFLHITAPGGRIFINGRDYGADEIDQVFQPGTYKIKVSADKYYPEEKNIILTAGRRETIEFALTPIEGSLSITVVPYEKQSSAKVYIDGEYIGTAPQRVNRLVGDYEILVKIEGSGALTRTSTVLERENTEVKFDFTEANREAWVAGLTEPIGKSSDKNYQNETVNQKPDSGKKYKRSKTKYWHPAKKSMSGKRGLQFIVGINSGTIIYNDKTFTDLIKVSGIVGVYVGVEHRMGPLMTGAAIVQRGAAVSVDILGFEGTDRYNYLSAFVTLPIKIGNQLYLYGGGSFSTMVSGTTEDSSGSYKLDTKAFDNDFGVILGMDYMINARIGLRGEVYVGLVDVMLDTASDLNFKNRGFTVSLLAGLPRR